MLPRTREWIVFALAAILVMAAAAHAQEMSATDKGRAIAEEADRRDSGFSSSTGEALMVLRAADGSESVRALTIKTLEVTTGDQGDKSLVIFHRPRDVAGTALLTHAHVLAPDDQWLFLPALRRVKRISSVNKSGPFMGSEFAYEDMAAQEVDKYSYRWLRDESCGDVTCAVIERTPRYEHSGYSRQVVWIGLAEYRSWRIDYYDRGGALMKTLTFGDYRQYLDRFWRAHRLKMINHQTGKSTLLLWENLTLRAGLDEHDFTRRSLKRLN